MQRMILMTGPHRVSSRKSRYHLEWTVEIAVAGVEKSTPVEDGKTYRVGDFFRAAELACKMAHDRRLLLRMEAAAR